MELPDIKHLLEKYTAGECSAEEEQQLEAWYRSLDTGQSIADASEADKNLLRELIWKQIAEKENFSESRPSVIPLHAPPPKGRKILRLAAAAVIAGILFSGGWYLISQRAAAAYVSVQCPAGKRMQLHLPDGSLVWLNGGCRLQYAKGFTHNRDILLENGEAFFKVVHEEQHPFLVRTADGVNVKDIGTAFNVKAYAELKEVNIAVLSGKVSVGRNGSMLADLSRDESIRVNIQNGSVTRNKIAGAAVNGWMEGNIILEDVNLAELAKALESAFGVSVRFNDPSLKQCRSSISFKEKDGLMPVLDMLRLIYGIDYQVNTPENTVMISGKGCAVK